MMTVDFGRTNQVNGKRAAFGDLGLGLLIGWSGPAAGLMATLGPHQGARSGASLALQGGYAFEPGETVRLTLLGELGLFYLMRSGEEDYLGKTTTTGGASRLPYVGARLLLRFRNPSSPILMGLVVKQTLGSATVETTTTVCTDPFLLSRGGCNPPVKEQFVDGGAAIGLTLGWTFGHLP